MAVKRYELGEAQWVRVAPLLPGKGSDPGRTGSDNRLFVNGCLWVLRSGAHWCDLPERYGKWKTVHRRFILIAELLGHREPIDAFSRSSNIPHNGIEQMICLGFLQHLDDPAILAGHRVRQLDGRSVCALTERLASCTTAGDSSGWSPITDAMKAVGGKEKPWEPAFAMMLDLRILPFAWSGEGGSIMLGADNIMVPATANDMLREAEFLRTDHPDFAFDALLTARDATGLLNIPDNKFTRIR